MDGNTIKLSGGMNMTAKIFNPFIKPKNNVDNHQEIEQAMNNGINGPVVTYYMPLEEVWQRWGKPGDLNGYEPSPSYHRVVTER